MDTSSISSLFGSLGSGKLGHALIGLLILVLGLIIVSLLARFIGRLINKVSFLSRNNLAKPHYFTH